MSEAPQWHSGPPTSDGRYVAKYADGSAATIDIRDGYARWTDGGPYRHLDKVVSHYGPIPDEPPPPRKPRLFKAKYRGNTVVGKERLDHYWTEVRWECLCMNGDGPVWLRESDLTEIEWID